MIIKKCSSKGALEVIPDRPMILDLNKIRSKYETITDLPILVMIKYKKYNITCYKNGKLIIRNCEIKEDAEKMAEEIYEVGK